jgi:hypothetical protein
MDAVAPGSYISFRLLIYMWHSACVEPGPYGCSSARLIYFVQTSCIHVTQCMSGAWTLWMQYRQTHLFRSERLYSSDTMHEWSLAFMDAVAPSPFVSFRIPIWQWRLPDFEPSKNTDLSAFADSWLDRLTWVNLVEGRSEAFISVLLYWRSLYPRKVLNCGRVWYAWNI